MKKLSKLNEGAISDIIKRATSDDHRIEDDINDMSPEEFYAYIKSKYSFGNYTTNIVMFYITIPLVKLAAAVANGMTISYANMVKDKDNYITRIHFNNDIKKNKDFYDELSEKFKFEDDNENVVISMNKNVLTNQTVLDIINIALKSKDSAVERKSRITEGVIGDIIKRAASDEVRIENDINNLDIKGIADYLKDKYVPMSKYYDVKIQHDTIYFIISGEDTSIRYTIFIYFETDYIDTLTLDYQIDIINFLKDNKINVLTNGYNPMQVKVSSNKEGIKVFDVMLKAIEEHMKEI